MISKLILGTVQMGLPYGVNNHVGKISRDECFNILQEAYQSGIRFLDTAEAYGDAHQIIGDFHRTHPDLTFNVITKLSASEDAQDFEARIYKYLSDLAVSQLDTLMFHSFPAYKKSKDVFSELLRLREKGLFKNLGVSIYTNAELKQLIDDETIDLIQLPFNLLDNSSLRGELLALAKQRNKILHTRSAFLQGLFFKDPHDDHIIVKKLKEHILQIREVARMKKISIESLALGYCLYQKNIDQVLIGVDSLAQLRNNMKAGTYIPDQETVELINKIHIENTDLLNPALWN
jgi:uncharacterized protein